MSKSEQTELLDLGRAEKKPKGIRRQMGFLGKNMREFVRAPKDKFCAKCERLLEEGSPVVKIAPLVNGKPDISKLEYFHNQNKGSCLG